MSWLPVLLVGCATLGDLGIQGSDCNRSGVDDAVEIAAGSALDCNANGLPDECELAAPLYRVQETPAGIDMRPELRALRAADVTGDGLDDVLEVYRVGTRLSVLNVHHAAGGGTFETVGQRDLAGAFSAFEAGDVDGDGAVDVVSTQDRGLTVLLNKSELATETSQSEELPSLGAFALSDLDGDGLPEVVAGSRRDVVWVENLGEGQFAVAGRQTLDHTAGAVAVTDLDGDGSLEVLASGSRPGELSVLRQAEEGGWSAPVQYPTEGRRLVGLTSADLDADGAPEVILATFDGLSVLWNRDGVLDRLETVSQAANTLNPEDVDGDGDVDLLAGDLNTRTLTAVLSDGRGGLAPALSVRLLLRPGAVVLGQFDGNGQRDIFVAENDAAGVALLRHGQRKEEGRLILRPRTVFIGDNPHSATAADFNGDGILDVIESGGHARRMVARLSRDGAPLVDQQGYLWDETRRLFSIDHGDFDHDGDLDVVMADSERHRLRVLWNRGDGAFENPTDFEVGRLPMIVYVEDVDADGWLDFVSAGSRSNTATVLFGGEDGDYSARRADGAVGSTPLAATAADLDGDGAAEVIVPNFASKDLSILRNQGGRSFAPQEIVPLLGSPRYVIPADVDGSGAVDLVLASAETDDLQVFLNDGAGGLLEPVSYPIDAEPYSVVAVDVTGDGILDLVSSNWRTDTVSVFEGLGDGTFAAGETHAVGMQPRFVLPGDYDRDGDVDLISANYASRDLTWLVAHERYSVDDAYLRSVCTEFEYHELSALEEGESGRLLRFLASVGVDDDLSLIFENTGRYSDQAEFLRRAFPQRFGGLTTEEHAALVAPGGSYWSGTIRAVRTPGGLEYGFGLAAASIPSPAQRAAVLEAVYGRLVEGFTLAPLSYLPENEESLEWARGWPEPPFSVLGLNGGVAFVRGDVQVDGRVNLVDAVQAVEVLFGQRTIPCLAAADVDGNGRLAVTDAIALLAYLFGDGAPPAPPARDCGTAPNAGGLGCGAFGHCESP